jgi:hypothetical protein
VVDGEDPGAAGTLVLLRDCAAVTLALLRDCAAETLVLLWDCAVETLGLLRDCAAKTLALQIPSQRGKRRDVTGWKHVSAMQQAHGL